MVKVGLRKPNLKTSLKARTTGRAKRAVRRAIIPGYGKKGMGWIKIRRRLLTMPYTAERPSELGMSLAPLLNQALGARRLGDSDPTQQQAPCSVDSTFDRNVADSGNWEQRGDGEAAARLELQRKNRAYMEENGIDVEMFTEEKVAADALRTIESVCPCMLRFDRGMSEEEPSISFCSPTKTGKMPKNVVEARIYHQDVKLLMDSHGFELPEYGDSINVMISYLADGRINKVDIHGFHNGRSVSVSIRRRSDDLVMTSAGTIGETGAWQSLCPGADPSAGDLFRALTKEVERIY